MELRTKLTRQVTPFLAAGEQIHGVFRAQSCFCIREAIATRCPLWHIIAVTDRAILVLDLSVLTRRPTRVRSRHDRNVYLGCSRMFALGDERYWVVREFDKEIAAADAALVEMMRWRNIAEVKLAGHDGATMQTVPPLGRHREPS